MKYVYMVNAWDYEDWECNEMAFSSTRELVRFMRLVSPRGTLRKRETETYACDDRIKHFLIKELHSDGVKIEFDVSRIILDYKY